jgi:hypothetical protein
LVFFSLFFLSFLFVCLLYYCRFFALLLFIFFLYVLSTLPSLSSHLYSIIIIFSPLLSPPSLSLLLLCYNPLLSFPTTFSAPSHLLSPPHFTCSYYPNQTTYHQTTPPSYTLTTCSPTYCTNIKQSQPPVIPDTGITLQQKYTQTHTKPSNPTLLPLLTHPTFHLPF